MKFRILPICLFFFSAFSLIQAEDAVLEPGEWLKLVRDIESGMEDGELMGLAVPLLRCPKLDKKWGEPQWVRRSKNGGYSIHYADPNQAFERIIIVGSPDPIPRLASVPDEEVTAMVNDELGVVKKPQAGKSAKVKWSSPDGPVKTTVRYFRLSSGGGADGPLDMTDTIQITSGGKTGYYVISVETVSRNMEKRLREFAIQ
ncbi:MAG: hypothetical protein MI807_15330 [Verrucomicrobiales bacterium]|nr:hypothetical protein [Verrucomicrobiales bacterium]